MKLLAAGSVWAILLLPAGARAAEGFAPACSLPFQGIAVTHPIDRSCGPEGQARSPAGLAQDRAKNNLCATGDPARVTLDDLTKLQVAAEEARIPFGAPTNLPADRSVLAGLVETSGGKRIGEGSLVQFAGFVLEARVARSESVNCYEPGRESNDIHITLADAPAKEPCDGFVAEMIPHFRPSTWTARNLNALRGRPVRITGHLLFDAGHEPCRGGRRVGSNPLRASLWEIHPVYAVDVCSGTDLGQCRASGGSLWKPLHEWASRTPRIGAP